jgi:hypothetical protein
MILYLSTIEAAYWSVVITKKMALKFSIGRITQEMSRLKPPVQPAEKQKDRKTNGCPTLLAHFEREPALSEVEGAGTLTSPTLSPIQQRSGARMQPMTQAMGSVSGK